MSSTSTLNGKPQRKQLSDQLDRLDGIIDALAEGLPGAVADACREGARAAVKDVLIEVLTNPELRALITTPQSIPVPDTRTPPEPLPALPAAKPSLWSRIKAKVASVRNSLTATVTKAQDAVAKRYNAIRSAILAIGTAAGEAFPLRRIGLVAAVVGVVAGVACLMMPQKMAAVMSAAGAATTAVSVQTGFWLKAAARRLGLLN